MRMFFAAAAAFAAPAAAAAPSQVEVVSAAEYQTGDYGTAEEVETLSIDNGVRVRSGRLQIYTSLPWLRISAPRNVVGGGGPLGLPILIDPTQPGARDLRQGIGDLRFGAAYSLAAPAGFDVTLEGQVKLPTASASRGLGTGELDFNIGAEASRSFGVVTPFATVSYTLPGEPNGYDVRDTLALRGGVALQLAPSVRGAVSYGEARSPSPILEGRRQIDAFINAGLSERLSLGIHGTAGLSDGSPDLGAAVRLGWRIF